MISKRSLYAIHKIGTRVFNVFISQVKQLGTVPKMSENWLLHRLPRTKRTYIII